MLMMDVIRNRPSVVNNSAKYLARNCLMCSNTVVKALTFAITSGVCITKYSMSLTKYP